MLVFVCVISMVCMIGVLLMMVVSWLFILSWFSSDCGILVIEFDSRMMLKGFFVGRFAVLFWLSIVMLSMLVC